MKKIFEFDIPEDNAEFEMYNDASKMHYALVEFANYLRNLSKYDAEPEKYPTEAHREAIEHVRDAFHQILEDQDIDLY